jgi:glycine cleavage system H protein
MTDEYRYSPSHEWIHIQGNEGTVGITEYAREELGETVYVELPQVGKEVMYGEEVVVLESTKAAADIYAPVSGEITEVNPDLKDDLTLLNKDPEGRGWLFKMRFSRIGEEDSMLLSRKQYEEMIHR